MFFEGGWFGEGEISYAGRNAEARARLAMEVLRERLAPLLTLRFDLIGVTSILGDDAGRMLEATPTGNATDVRLRVAGAHLDEAIVERLMGEVTALWTAGPAGGGGRESAPVFRGRRGRAGQQMATRPPSSLESRTTLQPRSSESPMLARPA